MRSLYPIACIGLSLVVLRMADRYSRDSTPDDVVSVRVTCDDGAGQVVQCTLLALSSDVSRAPRDVTADATWGVDGIEGARISPAGVIGAPNEGFLTVTAEYRSHRADTSIMIRRAAARRASRDGS